MYNCIKCNSLLNEFDVSFHKRIYPNADLNKCKCAKCTTGKPLWRALKRAEVIEDRKKLCGKLILVMLIAGTAAVLSAFNDFFTAIATITLIPFVIMFFKLIVLFSVDDYDGKEREYSHSTTEYTGTISGDTITFDKVTRDHYSGGSDKGAWSVLFSPVLLLTFPIWCLPYYLYTATYRSAMSKTCPKEVVDAFFDTKKETPKAILSNGNERKIARKIDKLEKRIGKTNSMYSAFGNSSVSGTRLYNIGVPIVIRINKQNYVVLDSTGHSCISPNRVDMALMATMSNDRKPIVKILATTGDGNWGQEYKESYFVYDDKMDKSEVIKCWKEKCKRDSIVDYIDINAFERFL